MMLSPLSIRTDGRNDRKLLLYYRNGVSKQIKNGVVVAVAAVIFWVVRQNDNVRRERMLIN